MERCWMCWASRRIGPSSQDHPVVQETHARGETSTGPTLRLELAHPFGSPATLGNRSDLLRALGFASPPYGGFAFVEDVAITSNSVPRLWKGTLPSAAGIRNRLEQT